MRFNTSMKYAEDELFVYHLCRFLNFDKHLYVNNVVYNYRQNPSSAVHKNKKVKLREHYESMMIMAQEYKECLKLSNLSSYMRKTTKNRYKYAVSNALYDCLFINDGRKSKDILNDLRARGVYPYGFQCELLKIKAPKTMLVNYLKFFFSVSIYYRVVRSVCQKLLVTY